MAVRWEAMEFRPVAGGRYDLDGLLQRDAHCVEAVYGPAHLVPSNRLI